MSVINSREGSLCIALVLCILVTPLVLAKNASDSSWYSANVKQKLPKLFEYDDFDECRTANPNFRYCVVQAIIQPDESSEIWRNISIISADNRNFPRDHLERGLCLHECLAQLMPLDAAADNQEWLVQSLDRCVNKALRQSYDLYASTTVLHCLSEEDFGRPFSMGEMAFLALVAALMLVIGRATLWDFPDSGTLYHSLIAPFSLPRNLNQLLDITTSRSDNDPHRSSSNLRCLEGLRAIFMLIILVVHSSLPVIRMPLKNPEDMERQTNSFIFPFVNSGNTHMITFFFAIGGMVQVVSFLSSMEKSSERQQVGFGFFCRKVLHRLARLLPAYLFIIFYQATLFPRSKPTPIAHKFIDYCDRNWWSNVLFVNNYVHLDEPCLKFGWYLGADFQLFLIGLVIMMFIWRFPRVKWLCTGLMVLVAMVTPTYVIYKEKLDATMGFHMRHALDELRTYNEFLKYYTLTSVNAGTYFFGMIAGLLYHHISKNNLQTSAKHYTSKLFNIVLVLFLSLNGFLTLLPSIPQTKPSWFLAIFGSALRAIWGMLHGTMFLLFAFKAKSVVVTFLEHRILRVLARLSYCIYIVQYSVIYMIYSNLDVPFMYGAFNSVLTANPYNYPRDTLERGICLQECLQELDYESISSNSNEKLLQNVDRCLNDKLYRSHGLQASVSILNCLKEDDFHKPLATSEKLFIMAIIGLVIVIGYATVCDPSKIDEYYRSLITPFCISRNINQLFTVSNDSNGSLYYLEGLRVVFMVIILILHSFQPVMRMPLKNPEIIERQTNSFSFPFFNSFNTHPITFFFAIGAMTHVLSFLNGVEKKNPGNQQQQVGVGFFCRKVLQRLARLLPAYLLVIFYQATLFPRTKPTPYSFRFPDYCDRHWWTNVLFVNHWIHVDKPCLRNAWYLGTDFQLFLIGMVIMMFIWRFPRAKMAASVGMTIAAFAMPAYVIYTEELEATIGYAIRDIFKDFYTYKGYLRYYTLTSVNASSYFFGMIAGLLYHHVTKNNLQSTALNYTAKLSPIVLIAFLAINGFLTILPWMPQERPSLFYAIYGSILRAIWGISHATLFLLFGFKAKSFVKAFLEHPILRVLSKLSYCIFLVQYCVIYTFYSNLTVPLVYDPFMVFTLTSAIMFITFIGAVLLYVTVELPFGIILKQAIDGNLNLVSRLQKKLL